MYFVNFTNIHGLEIENPYPMTAEGKSSAMIIVVFFRVVHMLASTIIGLGRSGIAL
jgi:hypothetical protein